MACKFSSDEALNHLFGFQIDAFGEKSGCVSRTTTSEIDKDNTKKRRQEKGRKGNKIRLPASRLIQYEYAAGAKHSAGETEQLFLPTRQV